MKALFCVLALIQVATIHSATLSLKCQVLSYYPNEEASICVADAITPLKSSDEEINFADQPSTYVNRSTKSISFCQPLELHSVPTKLFSIFPELTSILFENVSITNVDSDAIANCGLMDHIGFTLNNFTILPASFASTCSNLTQLNLNQNNIKELHEDSLKGLNILQYFYASHNNITCLPSGLFKHTPVISNIELGGNQISEIQPNAFEGLANIHYINLESNRIINLPALDFTGASFADFLSLQFTNNPINSISPQFVAKLFAISRLVTHTNVVINSDLNETVCFSPNSEYNYVSNYNWPVANISLSACYANWNDEYQTKPVSCATIESVETTTKKDEEGGDEDGEDDDEDSEEENERTHGHWPLGDKNYLAIITNAMKNFTANVLFH
jgi:hypothetical protein